VRIDQLEHLIRAAGAVLGEQTVIVVGSQAILASLPTPTERALMRSNEADILPLDDPDEAKADLIDGVLGAGSIFDESHGVHADGVTIEGLVLPIGWTDRLVELMNENTNGVRGLCLEPNDLVISKLAAGRPKDLEFCAAALRVGVADVAVVEQRLASTELGDRRRAAIEAWLRRSTT
jgi:hypothetical protein